MQISTPHFGAQRLHAHDIDYANRNAAPAVAADAVPTTIAPVDATSAVEKPAFDVEALAKSILSFVQERVAKAAAQGAAPDELAALLAQAREGVGKGFEQAVAQLKDSGALSDTLQSGISAALQKVDSGLSDLAKQYGISADPSAVPAAASTPTPVSTPAPAGSLSQLAAAYKASFSSRQSVDLVVKTADGDTVRLQLGLQQKQSLSASYASDANGEQLAVSARNKSSAGLSISVAGNLDAGELQALGDLLNQVGDLATSFFNGDIGAALQKAGSLDLSNPELSSLSLDLRSEVSARSAIATYAAVQSLGDASANDSAPQPASGLSDLATALNSLLPKASLAENPAKLLKQMLAAQLAASDQQNNPLLNFADRLLNALGGGAVDNSADSGAPAAQSTDATSV